MASVAPPFNHTITLVPIKRDRHNDWIYDTSGDEVVYNCHFREIVDVVRTDNREEVRADALTYLPADFAGHYGSVLRFESTFFRVIKIVTARGFYPDTQFIKCYLQKHEEVIS